MFWTTAPPSLANWFSPFVGFENEKKMKESWNSIYIIYISNAAVQRDRIRFFFFSNSWVSDTNLRIGLNPVRLMWWRTHHSSHSHLSLFRFFSFFSSFFRNQVTYFVINLVFCSTSSLFGSTALAAIKYDLAFTCWPICADIHAKLFNAAPCDPSELKHKRRHRRAKWKSPLVWFGGNRERNEKQKLVADDDGIK